MNTCAVRDSEATDSGEFGAFYAATADRLLIQLYLATGDFAEAQDCLQEAYIRAWQRWDRISTRHADPTAWVRTVAWRIAVTGRRRRLAYRRALQRHGPAEHTPGPGPDTIVIAAALRQLSHPQRTALFLYHYAGLPVTEIAQLQETPIGTAKARLARGRAALAAHLRD